MALDVCNINYACYVSQRFTTPIPGLFHCSFKFWWHVKAEHELNEKAFKATFADRYIVRKTTHVCGLCAKDVTFDNGKLKHHFTKYHPAVALEEYYDKIVKPAKEQQRVKRERSESYGSELDDSGLGTDIVRKPSNCSEFDPAAAASPAKRPRLASGMGGESASSSSQGTPVMSESQTGQGTHMAAKRLDAHPTSLVQEDGRPWYDGCDYQVGIWYNFLSLGIMNFEMVQFDTVYTLHSNPPNFFLSEFRTPIQS